MIRSLIGLSSLALIATKNNNRRKSLPQPVLPPARRQFGIQQYMTLPFQQRSKPGTIVNWAGSAATYPTNIELVKPNGAAYVVTNLSEFMTELLAASPGWRDNARVYDISKGFQFIFDPNHPRKEGITTHPGGGIVFLWRNLDDFGQTPVKGGYTQDFDARLNELFQETYGLSVKK